MKSIKLLGFAALAALAAMALIGVASAMATENTQLCNVDAVNETNEQCPAGNIITTVHEVGVGEAFLLSSAGTVECLVLFEGTTLGLGNTNLFIHGHFKYGVDVTSTHKCHLGGTICVVKEVSASWLIEVLKLGHETADVTGTGEFEANCGKILTCVYNSTNLLGTAKGPLLSAQSPDNGEVSLQGQTLNRVKGLFCPSKTELDIVTSPLVATYLAK